MGRRAISTAARFEYKREMSIVIADCRLDIECRLSLEKRGFELICLPPFSRLPEPVASHPDMLLFAGKDHLVCYDEYFRGNSGLVSRIASLWGKRLVLARDDVGDRYPMDVGLNAAPVGEWLVCKRNALSPSVASLYEEKNMVGVKQGYAKCSAVVVDDRSLITADRSIAIGAEKKGIDVLLVSPEGVELEGYNCGFIGGASGADRENVYFCGSVELHPDGEKIADFCRKKGKGCVSLSDRPLYDYGTLFFLP